MHLHLPKPLHGWREFTGEVGIIVIGVLIALGAEQVVEKVRWESEVADARNSLDAHLADAEFSNMERIQDQDCIDKKLDLLDDLISSADRPKIYWVDLSPIRLWGTSTWDSATASGAVAHMSAEVRNLYASLFTMTGQIGEMNRNEFELVGEVGLLDRPRTLSQGERDKLIEDIARLRQFNFVLSIGARQWLDKAKPLRLQVSADQLEFLRHQGPCVMPDDPLAAKA